MRSLLRFGTWGLLFSAVLAGGCIFSPSKTDPVVQTGEYKPPTSPENVINNLQVSYRRKEVDRYAPLLRHDFIFVFQPDDAQEIGTDFWTRDEDSTGTENLFTAQDIRDIRIDLTHGPAQPPTEEGFPDGTMWIRISPTDLEVDQLPDIVLTVEGDIQDFYFLPGNPDQGEDPNHWYILEWRDKGDFGGVGKPGVSGTAADGRKRVSWGELMGFAGRTR